MNFDSGSNLSSTSTALDIGSGKIFPVSRGRGLPRYPDHHFSFIWLFMLFTVAYYMCWGARRSIFSMIRFEFLVGAALAIICIFLIVFRPLDMRLSKKVIWGIGLLLLAMVFQLPFAADPVNSRVIFTDRVVKCAMLAFYMAVLLTSPRYLRMFLFAFLFACFFITQESVRGLISGGLVWENQGVMRLHGSVRLYAHPNSLAGLAMGTIPFVVFLFPVLKDWRFRAGLLVLSGTALTCIVYSGSRTAYVAILAFLLFWWLISRNKVRSLAIGIMAGALILAVLPEQYIERFKSIGGQEASGHSKEKRIVILQDAWQIFLENPLGVGVASFPAVRWERFGRSQDTHNLLLEVATNLGLQGLVVFIFLVSSILATFRKAWVIYGRQRERLRKAVGGQPIDASIRNQMLNHDRDLAFLAATCKAGAGFIFVRLVLGLFGMDLYEVYWWFASGLAICLINMVPWVSRRTEFLETMVRNKNS